MITLLCVALLPSIIIGFILYLSDKKEREPVFEVIKAFLLGIIAIFITLVISFIIGVPLIDVADLNKMGLIYYCFIGVALIEEFSKWVITHLFVRKNNNFNYMYDGIVYFSFVSLGFATIENVLYILSTDLSTAFIRAVTTVPAHVFFAMTAGYYYTLSLKEKHKNNISLKNRYLLLSLVMPVLLHGFFDFCLLTQEYLYLMIFLVFVVSLYVVSIGNARKVEKNDRLIEE